MKTDTWTTNFGGQNQIHCQVIIEEITIRDSNDIAKAKELEEDNQHLEVRKLSLKYTDNDLYKDVVTRLSELDKVDLTPEQIAIRQELISFTQHFPIIFKPAFSFFVKNPPILKGYISVNGKTKNGYFKPEFNRYSNNIAYRYYTENWRKGTGGFTLKKAFDLVNLNILSCYVK